MGHHEHVAAAGSLHRPAAFVEKRLYASRDGGEILGATGLVAKGQVIGDLVEPPVLILTRNILAEQIDESIAQARSRLAFQIDEAPFPKAPIAANGEGAEIVRSEILAGTDESLRREAFGAARQGPSEQAPSLLLARLKGHRKRLLRPARIAGPGCRKDPPGKPSPQSAGILKPHLGERRVAPSLNAVLNVEARFAMAGEIERNRHERTSLGPGFPCRQSGRRSKNLKGGTGATPKDTLSKRCYYAPIVFPLQETP